MNLMELQGNKKTLAQRALRENYEIDVNLNNLNAKKTLTMLSQVRSLIKESGGVQQKMQDNRGYLKLVMMEQMLSEHYKELRVAKRLVLENEEVQKSQVILAAQDMIDSIQKMVEQISKMNVEELPAVVNGIENEIGTQEGQEFQQTVSASLTTLQQTLQQTKSALDGALGQITGTAGEQPDAFGGDVGDAGDMNMGGEEEFGVEELPDGGEEEFGAEEEFDDIEEPEDLGGAGRERR